MNGPTDPPRGPTTPKPPETLPAGSVDDLFSGSPPVTAAPVEIADGTVNECLVCDDEPREPDAYVIAELARQSTGTLIASTVKFADLELGNLGARGVELADSGWDLVSNILLQTREGTLKWDPRRCTLSQHVYAVIQWKGRRVLRSRYRERSIDEMLAGHNGDGTGEDVERNRAAIERALGADRPPAELADGELDRMQVFARFERAMWKLVLARRDADVTAAFESWTNHHAMREAEVARQTGLPLKRATRAVRILRSLAKRLPAALQDDIRELLT
ncbi:MAG: hypothetical protein F9K40_03285 [Kofleriaceae bacterium]|nr:MAG: hypothetical protein F9K40_03285 [Kofleriaceae bacterium]